MNSINAFQFGIVARQRRDIAEYDARRYAAQHPTTTTEATSRPRPWRVRWHYPARAGVVRI
jgi:hypothetical protein